MKDKIIKSIQRLMDAIIKLHPTFDTGNPLQEECYLAYHSLKDELRTLEQGSKGTELHPVDLEQVMGSKQESAEEILDKLLIERGENPKLIRSAIYREERKLALNLLQSYYNSKIKEQESLLDDIKQARNNLYNDMPTGDVSSFELIDVIKKHIGRLDIITEQGEKAVRDEENPYLLSGEELERTVRARKNK